MSKGATVVIWYRDQTTGEIYVLVGQESRYLSDEHNSEELREKQYLKNEKKVTNDDFLHIKMRFGQMAKELEKKHPDLGEIRFDTPKFVSRGRENGFSVNYRYLDRTKSKYGILKGGIEPDDNNDMQKTAFREVTEEIGIQINKSKLVLFGECGENSCFHFELKHPDRDIPIWIERIQNRKTRNYGEIFNLSFKKIDEVLGSNLNFKSKCALELFMQDIRIESKPKSKTEHTKDDSFDLDSKFNKLSINVPDGGGGGGGGGSYEQVISKTTVPKESTMKEEQEKEKHYLETKIFSKWYEIQDKEQKTKEIRKYLNNYDSVVFAFDDVYDLWRDYEIKRDAEKNKKKGGRKSKNNKKKLRRKTKKQWAK